MGLGEALASQGQGVEDVKEVPAGSGQDKLGIEDVREVLAGHRQDKQGAEDVREVPAGQRHSQSRVGLDPFPGFPKQVGARYNQPIVPLWQWKKNISRRSI